MRAFLDGFKDLIPLSLLKIFDENELELLMCGIGTIDVRDWKEHTNYKGEYNANHLVIQWFWRVCFISSQFLLLLLLLLYGANKIPMPRLCYLSMPKCAPVSYSSSLELLVFR